MSTPYPPEHRGNRRKIGLFKLSRQQPATWNLFLDSIEATYTDRRKVNDTVLEKTSGSEWSSNAVSILRRWGSSRSSDSVATRQIHFQRPALDSRWFLSWFLRYVISFVAIAPFRREFVLFFPYNASVEFLAKEKSYFVDPASFPGDIRRSTGDSQQCSNIYHGKCSWICYVSYTRLFEI